MGAATNINHAEGVVEIGTTRRPFLVYWKQSINVKRDTPIATQDMLVRYSDFRRRKIKVASWLANYDEIEEQIDLIVETILSPGMYREFRWLMLTQAIESFHRKTIGGSYMETETYLETVAREIKGSIPSNLPRDHRESLKSKIDFGYEYSMNRRLKDFLSALPNGLVDRLLQKLGGIERKVFTNRVKETRNYYTHYDQAMDKLSDSEQDEYSVVLKQLMLAHLMKHMGFTDRELHKAFFPN